jgi:hypothetical protein
MKLYNVPEDSQVGQLVNQIEETAKNQGLTLSRWQANKGGFTIEITYIVHTGEREAQARHQPEDSIVAITRLSQMEGTTARCQAYRELTKLANELA